MTTKTKATKARMPANLQAKGKALWTSVTTDYILRADEVRILEDACREADLIERMERELRGEDLIVRGSMGQPVANPLAQEIRQHRGQFARLMKQLDLPDGDVKLGSSSRSTSARAAAQARWRRGA